MVAEPVPLIAATEAPSSRYAGIVTRAIAFAIDAVIINVVAVLTAAAVVLIFSVLPGSQKLHGIAVAIAGVVYVGWCVAYLATFWTTTGQTPGDRIMRIRVTGADGSKLHVLRAIARVGATFLAALPLGAGFIPIVTGERRRGMHDWIVNTIVTHAPPDALVVNAGVRGSAARAERALRQPPR